MSNEQQFLRIIQYSIRCLSILLVVVLGMVMLVSLLPFFPKGVVLADPKIQKVSGMKEPARNTYWSPPDSLDIPPTPEGDLIRFGRELIANTAIYLGPNGTVNQTSNGMNCQNCHLKAGKKIFGNNYSAVSSTYPRLRARSGSVEDIKKRVNDCIERSLNGKPLEDGSRELDAFIAYISWVGKDVEKGVSPPGVGLWDVPLLDRAASPEKGKLVFERYCALCHGQDGLGVKTADGSQWKYPPLWGDDSYNTGAGLHRLSRFAGYVKANMPNGATFDNPILTDEEAWDVAAFVNSMPRPQKSFAGDWPDISKKPFDHPYGPYADSFSEEQHKYGPFTLIKKSK
jgi:thiosulfate dehydrogenase